MIQMKARMILSPHNTGIFHIQICAKGSTITGKFREKGSSVVINLSANQGYSSFYFTANNLDTLSYRELSIKYLNINIFNVLY